MLGRESWPEGRISQVGQVSRDNVATKGTRFFLESCEAQPSVAWKMCPNRLSVILKINAVELILDRF